MYGKSARSTGFMDGAFNVVFVDRPDTGRMPRFCRAGEFNNLRMKAHSIPIEAHVGASEERKTMRTGPI
jgi:hypothetical protein